MITVLLNLLLSVFTQNLLNEPDISNGVSGNVGEPAFVTQYLPDRIEEALRISKVPSLKAEIQSYAGFFTVVNETASNMFFWYFPTEANGTAPVVLWLQGGFQSSCVGVFEENGPISVRKTHGLKLRKKSWTKVVNMLYIDSPIGTGFSFTTSEDGYSKNVTSLIDNLLKSLLQFFIMFPELKNNSFYIAGESKFIPSLADYIDQHNGNSANDKINLKGISIGNAFIDPVNMLLYGQYLYQIGLIDAKILLEFQDKEKRTQIFTQAKQYDKAFQEFDELIYGHLTPYKTLFYNRTKFTNYMNCMQADFVSPFGDFSKYIQSDLARRSIHVGNQPFHVYNKMVEQYLLNEVMQSVRKTVEKLIKKYPILIYNGQLDIITAYPLTVNFIKNMQWSGSTKYKGSSRYPFYVNDEIAGYFKKVDNLYEVMIRYAGHMVPMDQPAWALELIRCFTYNDATCFTPRG